MKRSHKRVDTSVHTQTVRRFWQWQIVPTTATRRELQEKMAATKAELQEKDAAPKAELQEKEAALLE